MSILDWSFPVKTDDFSFDLPPDLVAQVPTERRGESRLLVLDRGTGSIRHRTMADITNYIETGTLMVFNDSRVRKARLYATARDSGARVEFLLLRRLGPDTWEAAATKLKKQRPGRSYDLGAGVDAEVLAQEGEGEGTRVLRISPPIDDAWLEVHGHIPLPPYIKREDGQPDAERYQTIYSRAIGSAAAPTAGLHFTEAILSALAGRGVETAFVTLHVGLGTFLPVRSEEVEGHAMHREEYEIPEETALAVGRAKAEGRPVLAVGTTSVRTLESAWDEASGSLRPGPGSTRIFMYPGYRFKAVDRMFTNFHTPKSTLLMLVSAFAGREAILAAYAEAVRERYRFFSYGDAMLIL